MSRRLRRNLATLLVAATVALAGGTALLRPDSSAAIPAPVPTATIPASPASAVSAPDLAPGELANGDFARGAKFPCTVALVNDGDTLRCREAGADGKAIRIRLSGIAARERDGSCGRGHPCPAASAEAATATLTRIALDETLACRATGTSWNRVAAFCRRADGVDLSCAMLDSGTVAKWPRYWGRHAC